MLGYVNFTVFDDISASVEDGVVTLTPFEKIPLRAADIRAYGVDPSRFQSAWPKASLDLRVKADIGTQQQVRIRH